jgi:hypothetical protein
MPSALQIKKKKLKVWSARLERRKTNQIVQSFEVERLDEVVGKITPVHPVDLTYYLD